MKRSLLVMVFDTLRIDFFDLAAEFGFELPAFRALFALAPCEIPLWCGSFPTVPMRTDLLTGRLCFLDRRWDRPHAHEAVWPAVCRPLGQASVHIGDNYMLWQESLGGYFGSVFDQVERLRGIAADPWQPIPDPLPFRLPAPQVVRSVLLEAQFRANLAAGSPVGSEAASRLFECATAALPSLLPVGGVLWLESFQCHEPWAVPARDGEWVPGFPKYGRVGQDLPQEELVRQRRLYALRLKQVDDALSPFVQTLYGLDVDLLVLSDHGVYLGEHGLFGKPKAEPILPILGRLVCRVSSGLVEASSSARQPHELAACLFRHLGADPPQREPLDSASTHGSVMRLLGRNSPASRFFEVLHDEGIVLFSPGGTAILLPWSDLDPAVPWESVAVAAHPAIDEARNFSLCFSARSYVQRFFP